MSIELYANTLEELRIAYGKGIITTEEYDEMREDLGNTPLIGIEL